MPMIVGVRFKDSGKIYHFDPNGHALNLGDAVVVETVRGLELGKVAIPVEDVAASELYADLKNVIRQPTYEDYDRIKRMESRQDEVLRICSERIAVHKLPMRLVRGEWSFDGSRLTVYFTSQQRVDFRHLVRELARIFHARIELRQVGARDEAKLLGGIGPCGRMLCCSTFLPDFARVSVKMAKDQDLPLNPSKISGVCGRLLCCLSYEQEQYLAIKEELPRRGDHVMTPDGPGTVVAINTIRETVTVDVEGTYADYGASQLTTLQGAAAPVARERVARGEAAPAANNQRNLLGKQRQRPSGESRMPRPLGAQPPAAPPGAADKPGEPGRAEAPALDEATAAGRQDQRRPQRGDQNRTQPNQPRPKNQQRPTAKKRPGQGEGGDFRRHTLPVAPELLTNRQRQAAADPDEPRNAPRRRKRGQRGQGPDQQRPPQQAAPGNPPADHQHAGTRPGQQPRERPALPADHQHAGTRPGQQPRDSQQPDDGQRGPRRRRRRGGGNPPAQSDA